MRGVGLEGAVAGVCAGVGVAIGNGGLKGQVTVGAAAAIDAFGPGHEFAVGKGRDSATGQDGAHINLDDVRSVDGKSDNEAEQKRVKSASGRMSI